MTRLDGSRIPRPQPIGAESGSWGTGLGGVGRGVPHHFPADQAVRPARLFLIIRTFINFLRRRFRPESIRRGTSGCKQGIPSTMNLPAFQFVRPLPLLFLAGVALVMVVAGCGVGGPAFHPVSGKLTIDGQIPANVQVSFFPVDGKGPIASGNVDAGTGRYEPAAAVGSASPPERGL